MPRDLYLVLRGFAFYTDTSMNETILKAVRAYLAAHGSDEEIKALVADAQRRFAKSIERLEEEED